MVKLIKAPDSLMNLQGRSVFLAGSIEGSHSINWQDTVSLLLQHVDITLLDPRRTDWDASWVESISDVNFKHQTEWELAAMELADFMLLNFVAGSNSAISLLELGLQAHSGKVIIVCPPDYWKKGNVDMVASRYNLPVFVDIQAGVAWLKHKLG